MLRRMTCRGLLGSLHRPAIPTTSSIVPLLRCYSSAAPAIDTSKYQHFDPSGALDSKGRIPISPYDIAPLYCTAPESPKGHLIIHPHTQLRPQETWPSAIESISPFVNALGTRCKSEEMSGWSVSFSEGDSRYLKSKEAFYPQWNPHHPKVDRPTPGDPTEEEEFIVQVYTGNGKHATIGPFSTKTLPAPKELQQVIQGSLDRAPIPSARYPKKQEEAHVYVCTHGSRDCRCGVVGEQLKEELKAQVRKHQLRVLGETSKTVKVFGISHVGGHKWAANALVYPHGDWYGNLRVTDAPLILRSALAPSTSRHDLTDQRERLVHWPRWRGRIGLTKEKMQKVWDEWGGGTVETAVISPAVRRGGAKTANKVEVKAQVAPQEAQTVTIPFRKHSGEVITADAKVGENIKDVAKRIGIEEIEATCGGKCECATCHAYLADRVSASDGTLDLNTPLPTSILPPADDEESDMLDYAVSRKPTSRLTCQVIVTEELAKWFRESGGTVQLSRY